MIQIKKKFCLLFVAWFEIIAVIQEERGVAVCRFDGTPVKPLPWFAVINLHVFHFSVVAENFFYGNA